MVERPSSAALSGRGGAGARTHTPVHPASGHGGRRRLPATPGGGGSGGHRTAPRDTLRRRVVKLERSRPNSCTPSQRDYDDYDRHSEMSIALGDYTDSGGEEDHDAALPYAASTMASRPSTTSMMRRQQQANAWDSFAEHIVSITSDGMNFQMKPTSAKGSLTFKEVLEEMHKKDGIVAVGVGGVAANSTCFPNIINNVVPKNNVGSSNHVTEVNNLQTNENREVTEQSRNASRMSSNRQAHVSTSKQQTKHSKKKGKSEMGESHVDKPAPAHTAWGATGRMTEQERLRQDLYRRYLYQPTPWHAGIASYDKYKHVLDEAKKSSAAPAPGARRPASSPAGPTGGAKQGRRVLPRRPQSLRPISAGGSSQHSEDDSSYEF